MTDPSPDPEPGHRGRRAGRRKLHVLHGARRVIAQRGADATRFRDVAAETGSAVSTLQYSFGSREDLIIAALEDAAKADFDRARRAAEADVGPVGQLRALVVASVVTDSDEEAREAWLIWVEYWRAAARDRELRSGSAAVYARWRALVGGILTDGRTAGDFRSDLDTDLAATQVLALLDGVGVPVVLEHPGMTSAHAAVAVLDALAGILGCEALRGEPA
ncbi:MAG TPA: TetR/AcrR family transcriptional regulator [Gaiellales bacterium]